MPTTGLAQITVTKPDGTVINVSQLSAFDGDAVSVTTKDLDLGDQVNAKYVDGIELDFTNRGALTYLEVQVSGRDRHEDPLEWVETFGLAHSDSMIYPRMRYRYVVLKIIDRLPLARWKLSRINFFGRAFNPQTGQGPRGRR